MDMASPQFLPDNCLQKAHGRGQHHLSAQLEEGDVVIYQAGNWQVDGIWVREGQPELKFACVDYVQCVWTHNCEHGRVGGTSLCLSEDGKSVRLLDGEDVDFGPEQLVARVPAVWQECGCLANLAVQLPPLPSLVVGEDQVEESPSPRPLSPPPPLPRPLPPSSPPLRMRRNPPLMQLECTEDNVKDALELFKMQSTSMFGCHPAAAQIGISGDVILAELDGPVVYVELNGRFWHKRSTVLRNARAYLLRAIPELADVDVLDSDELLDTIVDEDGQVIEDRRSPDWNGDRETLEYQGIDPDSRGPFS